MYDTEHSSSQELSSQVCKLHNKSFSTTAVASLQIAEAVMLERAPEKRRTFRRPARRAASVSFGPEAPPVTCVIWDISEGGARLAIARPIADLPRNFVLYLYKN